MRASSLRRRRVLSSVRRSGIRIVDLSVFKNFEITEFKRVELSQANNPQQARLGLKFHFRCCSITSAFGRQPMYPVR
jgi:hypothetical protein